MDQEMHRLAWHAANIMNVHTKKKITVKQLLGKEKRMTREEKLEKFEQLKQKLN